MAIKKHFFYQNLEAGINKELDLNEEQKFWRKHTYMRYAYMKEARQANGREDKWKAWQKQYEAWRPPKGLSWQSNIVPPFTTSVVESALSEMVDQNLMPMVGPRKKVDAPKATTINYVKNYSWDVGYGDVELYKAIKQQLILGTTFWQEYYLQEKQTVKILTSYDPKTGKEEHKEIEMLDFDDVYGEAINLWEVWFDPDCRSVNTGPYKAQDAIRRYIMHIDVFRNTFVNSRWDKFKLANKVKPSGDTNYYQYYKPPQGMDHGSQVEVIWHWIRQPDILVIMANDIPFYIGPKPYNHKKLPFARGVDILDPWSLYGKGEPALLESIQDELTTNRRMRLDRQKLDVYKMVFIQNRETITEQDLIPAPMKPVYVDDVNNIKPFEYGDINPSAYREEMLLKEDAVRVTGIDDRAQSVAQSAGTATEAAILKESTLKRLRTKIWLTSKTLLTEAMELRVPNIIQFYQVPKIHQIMGKDAIDKWMKIREVSLEGRLIQQGNQFFEQEYRTIVTKNKKLERTNPGEINVVDERGEHFFMVTPDVLIPSEAGFNYKLSAEPTVPLSRPLLQQKVSEFMQHPVIQAAFENGYYDISKAADKLTEINDFDVDDFLANQQQGNVADDSESLIDPERMMNYASQENGQMLQGVELPGTPYSTSEHTLVHVEFMKSPEFQGSATPEIINIFQSHIQWEVAAQEARSAGARQTNQMPGGPGGMGNEMGGGTPGGSIRTAETQGINSGEMKATVPAKQVGPENLPDLSGFSGFGPGR